MIVVAVSPPRFFTGALALAFCGWFFIEGTLHHMRHPSLVALAIGAVLLLWSAWMAYLGLRQTWRIIRATRR
jgi:hypothetical protein